MKQNSKYITQILLKTSIILNTFFFIEKLIIISFSAMAMEQEP